MPLDLYTILAFLFIVLTFLTLLTYLKINSIIDRDGPAKIEVNKKFEGVLLEHAEMIPTTSPLYLPFLASGFRFDSFAKIFFNDFQDSGSRLTILQWFIRVTIAIFTYVGLYLEGQDLAAYAIGLFLVVQSLCFDKLSMYYFLRYHFVSFKVELIEDDEQDEEPYDR